MNPFLSENPLRKSARNLAATFVLAAVCVTSQKAGAAEPDFAPDAEGFQKIVEPFFRQHCVRCHGSEEAAGEFRVDSQLSANFLDVVVKGRWGEVINVLNSHEMPPEDEPQPSQESVAEVVDWITQQMARAELHRRDSAIVLRRMNRSEYRNTIRDLVGVDFNP